MQMFPNRCTHSITDAYMHWMMLHSIGQRHIPDAHMPCQMHASLGWWCMLLAYIAFLESRRLSWCCLEFFNIDVAQPMHTRHWWPLCSSHSMFIILVHAKSDTVGPCTMSANRCVGKRLWHKGNVWCLLTIVVSQRWCGPSTLLCFLVVVCKTREIWGGEAR